MAINERNTSRRAFLRRAAETGLALTTATVLNSVPPVTYAIGIDSYPNSEKPETEPQKAERKIPIGVNLFDAAYDPNYKDQLDRLRHQGISMVRIIAANHKVLMATASEHVHHYIEAARPLGISVAVIFMNHYGDQGHYPKEVDFRFFTQGRETPQLDQSFYKNLDSNNFPEFVDRIVADNKNHPNLHSWQLINEARTKKSLLIGFIEEMDKLIRNRDSRTPMFSGVLSTANTGTTAQELYGEIANLHPNGNCYDGEKIAELLKDAHWAALHRRQMSITELGYDINTTNRTRAFVDGMDLWENSGTDSIFLWGLKSHRQPLDKRYGLTETQFKEIMQTYRKAA